MTIDSTAQQAAREQGNATSHRDQRAENALDRATEWLDAELLPVLGPPPLGPYDQPEIDPPQVLAGRRCPICRHPMAEHAIEVSADGAHTYIHHPDASIHEVMEIARP